MDFTEYGHDMHPVIVIGPEHPNQAETELYSAITMMYGDRNLIKFTNYVSASRYLHKHKGTCCLNPTIVAVYTFETEDDISNFFFDVGNISSKKILGISNAYDAPFLLSRDPVMNNDDILYLYSTNQSVKMQELRFISGDTLLDHKPVEHLCDIVH